MQQHLSLVSLVVADYDEAIRFYVEKLGFVLIEDTEIPEQKKRWVVVAPQGATETRILLAKAADDEQASRVGNQTGGRVFLFLYTDDIKRDFTNYSNNGVVFTQAPTVQPYGTVAIFNDVAGNLWDLIQPT